MTAQVTTAAMTTTAAAGIASFLHSGTGSAGPVPPLSPISAPSSEANSPALANLALRRFEHALVGGERGQSCQLAVSSHTPAFHASEPERQPRPPALDAAVALELNRPRRLRIKLCDRSNS